ncbi:hypothetical protein [Hoeflea prorocentri]|uniref:Uncharacterized protein n=1 Tax=Hoeflea prorocentri TaxID=1922333 RepID=A0A9X3UNS5_9HYPH|nr:hypothetical protein [Hoeflea prorocentri]MCY6382446.1 hypothetical protein [Hoeflea prorocentri]MDA5400246.1 hypothetical protein [Hoeflea prorocentri]
MAFLAIAAAISAMVGLSAHYLAIKKNRAVRPWVFASVLFVLPLALLALLPARQIPVTALDNK